MWCFKPAKRSLASYEARISRCKSLQHRRRSATAASCHHDDEAYVRIFEAMKFTQSDTQQGYQGYGKRNSKAAQSLLKEMDLFKPIRPVRDPFTSKAYDPNNTFPDRYVTPAARVGSEYFKTMEELRHVEAEVLAIARKIAHHSEEPHILRRALWRLFDQCETAHDVMRVLAFAYLKRGTREALQNLGHPIVRALYRARVYATDRRIYAIYKQLITRLEEAGLRVDVLLYISCVKFAARSRDPLAMQQALWSFRKQNIYMSYKIFRAIIAKLGLGINGFGEIRNGKWRIEDVLPLLNGFEGTKIKGGKLDDHHLKSFVHRSQWGYVQAWAQLLAHWQFSAELWDEWIFWRNSPLRIQDQRPARDEFFIAQMLIAGDGRRAWQIFEETQIDFDFLKPNLQTQLLEIAAHFDPGTLSGCSYSKLQAPTLYTLERAHCSVLG